MSTEKGVVDAPSPQAIGYLPATAGSWPSLTVAQNMDFVGGIYGLAGKALVSRRDGQLRHGRYCWTPSRPATASAVGRHASQSRLNSMANCSSHAADSGRSNGAQHRRRPGEPGRPVAAGVRGGSCRRGSRHVQRPTAKRPSARRDLPTPRRGGRMLARGTLQEVLDSFDGAIARTATPHRRAWAWRRGGATYHSTGPPSKGYQATLPAVIVGPGGRGHRPVAGEHTSGVAS